VRRERSDLVLMDVGLGDDMDGIAAADAIRAHHDVPIVFLTMRTDADTISRAERLEHATYLQKSCSEQEFRFTIESLLDEAGAD
jgi:DNA-binding NarL/FixJ family response regulator